jgi:hypothetical protein
VKFSKYHYKLRCLTENDVQVMSPSWVSCPKNFSRHLGENKSKETFQYVPPKQKAQRLDKYLGESRTDYQVKQH